jgi:hypothetical protein
MTGYVCGPCAIAWHPKCTGLLRTAFGFCACADRGHEAAGESLTLEAQLEQLAAAAKGKGPWHL